MARAALIVWLVYAVHPVLTAILLGILIQLVLCAIAAAVGPNHDSPWILPGELDEPCPAPIDRIDVDPIAIYDQYGDDG